MDRESLILQYRRVRAASIAMCEPLEAEDYRVQPFEEVSPPWWNLGHTSWFFARNVIGPLGGERTGEDEALEFLLNSYYVALGPRVERFRRGLITRPTTEQIYRYRASVDERIERLVAAIDEGRWEQLVFLMTVGINHEQQHQELFYTEIKSILHQNPAHLRGAYRTTDDGEPTDAGPVVGAAAFVDFDGGLYPFGHQGDGWAWDNELPVHQAYVHPFALQDRLVTCGEWLEFLDDGGYGRQLLWLDNGWATAAQAGWQAPLYWERIDRAWHLWTLGGMRPVDPAEPVCHVSYYEAEAFARWKSETFEEHRGVRLPTEYEWELAARAAGDDTGKANFLDTGRLHPAPIPASPTPGLRQMLGDTWEWTSSYYGPYPGYVPFPGDLAEYNGKFMDNQRVLRGGSCVGERDHVRITYRNFWAPATRFQFTGVRLARSP
jgi:ergothioneine biosynthesis protein EgtB